MKEFVIYTVLRLLLFLAAVGIVGGIWALVAGTEQVPAIWVVVLAFLFSGGASMVLLNRQREAFARRVETRASAASAKYEEMRGREDAAND